VDTFFDGIAPEHAPALVAGLITLVVVPLLRGGSRDLVNRWAAALLGYAAAVHLFLPFGHIATTAATTVAYLLDALGFGALSFLAFMGRRGWRLGIVILVPATVLAYLIWGGDPDQAGILTVLLELTAFGLAVATRVLGSIATVLAVLSAGAVMWVASFKAHQAADAASPAVGHHHGDSHEHLARAQAGVIMRPLGENRRASAAETAAAVVLAQATASAGTRYARLSDAIAAGYRYSIGAREGLDVHLENPEYKKDGRILDPQRPEMLVYAIDGGRATLLGVVYVMERAGQAGPAPGGPITRWHAHNLCVSLAPLGIGIVTPYGGCPSLSVMVTIPEMMHVWIVDPPGGPFAESIDPAWATIYHARHGLSL
jgi:hypothetical protein